MNVIGALGDPQWFQQRPNIWKIRACSSSLQRNCYNKILQSYSGLPGVKLMWKHTALDSGILFFSSLNYSRQILGHSFFRKERSNSFSNLITPHSLFPETFISLVADPINSSGLAGTTKHIRKFPTNM